LYLSVLIAFQAFSPGRIIPGIEFSPDKMLAARVFSYPDTQFHRLGPNFMKLPINCPYRAKVNNYQIDGHMCSDENNGSNTFNKLIEKEGID